MKKQLLLIAAAVTAAGVLSGCAGAATETAAAVTEAAAEADLE